MTNRKLLRDLVIRTAVALVVALGLLALIYPDQIAYTLPICAAVVIGFSTFLFFQVKKLGFRFT